MEVILRDSLLYLIEILHQTTTIPRSSLLPVRCILLKFYIKPQHNTKITTDEFSCILLKFYIKPQLARIYSPLIVGCILLKFYIKPQQRPDLPCGKSGCILLKFYIKPQRRGCYLFDFSALCRFVRPEN